jgi:hypothetical protein
VWWWWLCPWLKLLPEAPHAWWWCQWLKLLPEVLPARVVVVVAVSVAQTPARGAARVVVGSVSASNSCPRCCLRVWWWWLCPWLKLLPEAPHAWWWCQWLKLLPEVLPARVVVVGVSVAQAPFRGAAHARGGSGGGVSGSNSCQRRRARGGGGSVSGSNSCPRCRLCAWW